MALDINNKDENLSPNANSLINNIRGSDEIPIDLKYFLKIFARRSRIFYFSTFIPFSIFLILAGLQRIINPTYRGYFKILISDPISKKDYVNDNLRTKPFAVFDYGARNNEILSNDIPTLIEYLKSESVLKSILNEYNINYDKLSRNLEVKIVDKSKNFDTDPQVLYIVYHHKNKKKGLKILNSVAETYLEASLKMKQKRLSEGLNFLDSQEPELKKNTKILRDNIAVFREKNNLLDPKEEALALKSRLNDLDDKILKLGSEKERLKIIKQEIIKGNLVSSGLEISENEGKLTGGLGLFVTDSNQNILKELVELKNLYADYLTKYLPSSTLVKGIEERINYLEPIVLQKQLESVKSALDLKTGTINSLSKQREKLNIIFLKQPKYISEYQELENKLELALEKEKALVRARENFQLEITQRNIPWEIIKKPSFEEGRIENKKRLLLLGLLGSSAFGFLVILFRDISENVFYDKNSLENIFDENIISEIPFYKDFENNNNSALDKIENFLNYNLSKDNKNFRLLSYKESIRSLYTNLSLILSDKKFKILTLTSSISGEGKSLITSIIAMIFSKNNYKVLFVDSDLRRPTINNYFSLKNKIGLNDFLLEEKLDFDKYVNKINENLFIIPSRCSNSDPTKLLSSKKMDQFLENLRKSSRFDLVIFDTPPILGFSDYKLICKKSDALIFLVSLRFAKKDLIRKAYEEIKSSKFNILGIISNSLNKGDSFDPEDQVFKYYEVNNKSTNKLNQIFSIKFNKRLDKLIAKLIKFFSWLDK